MKKIYLLILVSFFFFVVFLFKNSSVLAVVEIEEAFCSRPGDARDSRPNACYICNQNELLTPACATSIKITTGVDYGPLNTGPKFEKEWGGTVNIIVPNSSNGNLKIPFVGMKGEEEEGKYLADYFEGTNEYYSNYSNQNIITNYQGVLRKLTPFEYQNQLKRQLIARVPEEAGIEKEGNINNYEVFYVGRICWDIPVWMEIGKFVFEKLGTSIIDAAFLSPINEGLNKIKNFFTNLFDIEPGEEIKIKAKIDFPDIGHYCIYANLEKSFIEWIVVNLDEIFSGIPGLGSLHDYLFALSERIPGLVHMSLKPTVKGNLTDFNVEGRTPPDPSSKNYAKEFLDWKNLDEGKWYRLWQAVPMLSREDTLGEIDPYLNKENEEKDYIVVDSGETSTASGVPHVARLHEASKIISDLLTPVDEEGKMIEMVETPEIPETKPPNICFKEDYLSTTEGDDICCGPFTVTFNAMDEFTDPGYYSNNCDTEPLSEVCQGTYTQTVSRYIGINLQHPYLDEIWSYTTNDNGGFFNLFRPAEYPNFEDIDAAQDISYSSPSFGSEEIVPQKGSFFFPHLGGIQTAKEWVVNEALWPYVK